MYSMHSKLVNIVNIFKKADKVCGIDFAFIQDSLHYFLDRLKKDICFQTFVLFISMHKLDFKTQMAEPEIYLFYIQCHFF